MNRRFAARRRAAHVSGFTSHLESLEERVYLSRIALAFDAGEKNAPTIAAVGVASSGWSSAFRENLLRSTPELPGGFVEIPADNPILPWSIDTVAVRFSEDVDVRAGDLTVTAGRKTAYDVLSFAYSRTNLTAVWTISSVTNDWARLNLSNQIQATATGLFLDGSTATASGASDAADITLKTLNSDITGDGQVSQADDDRIRDVWFSAIGDERYDHRADLNADGRIDREDRLAVGRNFAARLTSTPPQNTASDQTVAVSLISIGNLDEDFTAFTVPFAINSNIAPEADLQLSITTSDAGVLPAENLTLAGSGALRTLTVTPLRDASGQVTATLRITEGAKSTDVSIPIAIRSINDPPTGHSPPGTVRLTNNEPERTFSLTELFTDPDDSVLSYEIVSTDRSLVDVTIQDGLVRLRGKENTSGTTTTTLRATDAQRATAEVRITTETSRQNLEPLPAIEAAFVPDQIIRHRSRNVVTFRSNFTEVSRIKVKSTNPAVLQSNDISVRHEGDSIFSLTLNHSSDDYGLTFISVIADSSTIVAFAAAVLPSPEDKSETNLRKVSFRQTVSENGTVTVEKRFSARFLTKSLADGNLSAEQYFETVRPVTPIEHGLLNAIPDAILTQEQELSAMGVTADSYTILTANIPLSAQAKWDKRIQYQKRSAFDVYTKNIVDAVVTTYDPRTGSGALNLTSLLVDQVGTIVFQGALIGAAAAINPIAGIMVARQSMPIILHAVADIAADLAVPIITSAIKTQCELDLEHCDPKTTANLIFIVNSAKTVYDHLSGLVSLAQQRPQFNLALTNHQITAQLLTTANRFNIFQSHIYRGGSGLLNNYLLTTTNLIDAAKDLNSTEAWLSAAKKRLQTQSEFGEKLVEDLAGAAALLDESTKFSVDLAEKYPAYAELMLSPIWRKSSQELRDQLAEDGPLVPAYKQMAEAAAEKAETLAPAEPAKIELVPDYPISSAGVEEMLGTNGESEEIAFDAAARATGYKEPGSGLVPASAASGSLLNLMKNADFWKSAISTGKDIYDIAKTTKGIVGQVQALFDCSSNENGDYTDYDGKTWNQNQPQVRDGGEGRDIINGGKMGDIINAGPGDDKVIANDGNDRIDGGEGRNFIDAGNGDDIVKDGDGDSSLSGGPGNDTIFPGKGADFIDAGEGKDTIVINEWGFGRKVLLDPSKEGVLQFTKYTIQQISIQKVDYDLVFTTVGDGLTNALKFSGFFKNDAEGWVLIDGVGNSFGLYEMTGRMSARSVLAAAYLPRTQTAPPVVPQGFTLIDRVDYGRFGGRAWIYADQRIPVAVEAANRQRLFIFFDATDYKSTRNWLDRNLMAGIEDSLDGIEGLMSRLSLPKIASISVGGVGSGGLTAQWFAGVLASRQVPFVNGYYVNSPDISGMVSQFVASDVFDESPERKLVRTAFDYYHNGFPALNSTFIFDRDDLVSRIGIWSGYDETYATWKVYARSLLPADQGILPDVSRFDAAQNPNISHAEFDTLRLFSVDLSAVRGHVSLDNLLNFHTTLIDSSAQDASGVFHSTLTAGQVLSGKKIDDVLGSRSIADWAMNYRLRYLELISADPLAVTGSERAWLQFDFQAARQNGDHLAPGHLEVTEQTLFVPGVSPFGWESIDSLKAGDDQGRASLTERDSVKVNNGVFIIDLGQADGWGSGVYNVTITVGDRERIQEALRVYIDGYQYDLVSTMPGDYLTRSYQLKVTGDKLRIGLRDLGGIHDYTSIAAMTIEKVNYRSYIAPTETLESDFATIVITQSYDLPETSAAIEILKEVVKAVAVTVLTAGVGAALSVAHLGFVAQGLGGGFSMGANLVKATAKLTLGTVIKQIGIAVVNKVPSIVAGTLVREFVPSPLAQSVLNAGISMFSPNPNWGSPNEFQWIGGSVGGIRDALTPIRDAISREVVDPRNLAQLSLNSLRVMSSGLSIAQAALCSDSKDQFKNVAPWVFELLGTLTERAREQRLGRFDASFEPVDAEAVYQDIINGKPNRRILRHWKGSRQNLFLDWTPKNSNLLQISPADQTEYARKNSLVLKRLLEANAEEIKSQGASGYDVLFISHGAGYEINRQAVVRLERSEFRDFFDYVKMVTLDPVASDYDAFKMYHPEMIPLLDSVDNYYQTETVGSLGSGSTTGKQFFQTVPRELFSAKYSSVADLFSEGGGSLYHGGSVIGGLDSRDGGGSAGFYNRQGRLFDLTTLAEVLRYRHWDQNRVFLSSAEMTAIRFSPDGSLVATADMEGQISVRYAHDVRNSTGELIHPAGKIAFSVWGHQSIVRSVEFVELQKNGRTGLYLLSNSSAKDAADASGSRNKILLTDATTGLPVWQGISIGSTQVAASPSGNIIVSTDREGYATIWRRVPDELIYRPDDRPVNAHASSNRDWVADVIVFNDRFFATSGLDNSLKIFRIDENGATLLQTERFDNVNEGAVRNLDYDPINGLLAVGSGQVVSLWKLDQFTGQLRPIAPASAVSPPRFLIHDHVKDVQGIAFSRPAFLRDAAGRYTGDRSITVNGQQISIPRTPLGDIDQAAVQQLTIDHKLPAPWIGVVFVTGGEDRTIFKYTLDGLPIGSIRLEQVISGAMLPVKELALSADGRYLALVGDDNTDGSQGGPVRDVDVTDSLDKRLGWAFSEMFYSGRREHNAVPEQYVIDVLQGSGESFFWQRNSSNANRPGDLNSARNQALPPNKRGRLEGVDLEPIVIYPRPGQMIEIAPLQYVLETDRQHFEIRQDTLVLGNVVDTNNVVIGTMSRKVVKGVEVPDVFIFQASDTLDYSQTGKSRYTGVFRFDIRGPEDIDGNSRLINGAEMTIHVTNHQPVTVRDVVDLHPSRQITDLRPRRNDYDLEGDEFSILPFPTAWQTASRNNVSLFRYRRNPDSSFGLDIDVLVDTDTLDALLQADRASGGNGTYLAIELPYTVEETKYRGTAAGVIEVRLQLQSGPRNVRYSEHGADLILIQWDPVSWDATRYVVERWVDDGSSTGSWQRHGTNSEVFGKNASAVRISLDPSKEYWFRVTAVNDAFNRPRSSAQTKAEALHVKPVPYTAPDNIQMEALGSASVEVTWQGVFWKVDRYRIDLFEAIVDAETGVPIRDAAGNYQKDPNRLAGRISVDAALNSRVVFTQLNSGTAYIAEVTALNSNSTVLQTALSRVIAITPERDLPSGVDFVRTGPEQALLRWGTVPWASHYRILALDVHTLARIWSGTVMADNSKNTNTAVVGGLSPVSTYLVTVEARVRKTGEWVRLIDEDPAVAVLPNRDILPDDLAVGLAEDATRTRILPNAFEHTVTLPSLSGLFVGSRLTLLNFSRNNVLFRATDGSIRFAAQSGPELLLKAPFPVNSSDTGPIVLRFTARENPSDLNTLQWHLEPGDAMSEARRLDTPDFQATVGNRLEKSADTKPRRLGVVWESPFWNVKLHKLFLYEFDSSKPGNRGALKDWISVPMSEENTWMLQRTFTELTPATRYVVVMQTFGYDRRFHEIATEMETPAQFSPRDPRADLIRLREFRVRWTSVSDEWNAIGYRVVLNQKINDKWEPIREFDKSLEVDASATELLVKGLTPGTHYSFTVEAKTGYDNSWIPNSNVREVSTRQFQLPTADKVWLVSPEQTTRRIGLDWQAAFTIPNAAGFLFGTDTARVFWRAKGSTQPPSQSRLLTDADILWTIDTDLKRDTEYEVWIEFYAEGVSSPQKLSTKDGVTLKTKAAQPARSLQVPADKIQRRSFDVEWQHDDRDDVEGFTLEANWMDAWRRLAFRNADGEFVPATNLSRNTRRFTVAWIRNNSGDWVPILPGTTYQLRVITSFDRGTEPLTNTDNPPVSVTTRPNEPPRNVKISDIERWKFRVSWDAPVSGDHSGFTLTASADGGVTFVPVETAGGRIGTDLPASWTTVTLSKYRLPNGEYRSFQPGQSYLVRVFATYDDGAQKEPADINGHPVTMAGYVAPKDIVVSQVGLETATVSWTFTDPLGDPDHFVIDVSADDGRTYTKAPVGGTTPNATTRSQTIGGLEPGMTLRARVRSVYGSGDGEASLASAPFTTNPLPIKLNRIVLDGRRAVTPYWTELEAIPKTLQIQVRRFDPEQSQWLGWEVPVGGNIVEDKTRTSKQITKLWPGSRHELRLAATNSAGNVAYSNTLEFTTEAYPQIADPFTYDPNTTSITAAWTRLETLVSTAVVTDNIVEIFLDGRLLSPPFRTGSGSGPKHAVRLTGLSAGTTYEFRVTAWDETVLLSRSARYEFSTLVDGLNVDEVTAFSARATWTQFAGQNATNYRVRALVPGTDTVVSEKLLTIGSGVRSTTMESLQPSTKYEMLVEVLRNSTVLTTSKRAEFTTLSADLTGARLAAVRRFSMDVEWNSVAAWAAWTKVQWRVAGTTTWTGSGTLAATRTSYSVTDLKLTTKYEIRVSAGKGNFEREVILTATTADFVAPSKPDITNVQRTQVTLNWTFSDPAGNPDFFAIWRNGVKVAEVTDVSRRSFTNTGLTAGTNYRFVVRAVYKLGWKDSPESTVTTPAGVAPVITFITNITATNVTVIWSFARELSEVENFTIHRNNTDQTRLGTLNPASSPTLALPITRDSRAKWFIFVRVRYKDGTVVESALYQLPER